MSGGGIGGGLGGLLGTIAGVALAPETGGLSLAIPALGGALGGFGGTALGDAVTGEPFNLGQAALAGGLGGLGGFGGAALGGAGGLLDAGAAGAAAPVAADTAAGAGGATAAAAADPFATGAGYGFADLSGAGGGLGGGALPTATDFTSNLGGGIATGIGGETGTGIAGDAMTGSLPAGFGTSTGESSATLSSFAGSTPDAATGAASPAAGASAAAPAADYSFADLSGAYGGLGGGVAPTTPFLAGTTPGGSGSLGGIWNWLKANKDWLMPAGTALNLGRQALAPSQPAGAADLAANQQLAHNIAGQNANGLNPAQSAAFSGSLSDQIAQIKARYANMGLSGSTAEQQDIQKAQNQNLGAQASAVTGNVNTALGAIGASNATTQALAQQQIEQDQQLQQAIMALALGSAWGLSH